VFISIPESARNQQSRALLTRDGAGSLPPGAKFAMLQLHGVGPWTITYVNPADDPRTKK
jgi:hypothetical protein